MPEVCKRGCGKGSQEVKEEDRFYIGVVGSRSRDYFWDFYRVTRRFIKWKIYAEKKGLEVVVVSGPTTKDDGRTWISPKGGDRFAVVLANLFELERLWFPADWAIYGRSAGFKRNTDVAKICDVLISCVAYNRKGGTEDTIKKYIKFHGSDGLEIVL